ncbi:MAG: protein-glutamine glutaminase family protein [Flavipsychrobacter sp.]
MANQPKPHLRKTVKLTAALYIAVLAVSLTVINACKKSTPSNVNVVTTGELNNNSGQLETGLLTIANIQKSPTDNTITQVMFYERQEIFSVGDATMLATLQKAFANKQPVKVTTDPWAGTIKQVTLPTQQEIKSQMPVRAIVTTVAPMHMVNTGTLNSENLNSSGEAINMPAPMPGLTNVVPDLATAQLMFTYFAQQSCNLRGTLTIDQCISFQYVIDGCYARAHKMSWVIMNKYHYSVKKLFSYGNLAVKADKWGGCCVFWWYHVAPLVTINTPQGPKAYVMDPGMFDGPVPMTTWLKAQGNRTCNAGAAVTSYSIQPVTAYWPNGSGGYDEDPDYSMTNGTLVNYSGLKTCP